MASDIKLFNMDCMEALREMEDNQFDLAIVDPPYGINFSGRKDQKVKRANGTYGHTGRKAHEQKRWDKEPPPENYFTEIQRVSKNQIIWGGNYFDLPPTRGVVCWDKVQMFETMSAWEFAWSSFNCVARLFRYDNKGFMCKDGAKIHPTQKPVALYKWLLTNYAEKGQTILDTHLGSGSIALACWDLGFDLCGYELDEDYFASALNRLEEHKKQGQFEFV